MRGPSYPAYFATCCISFRATHGRKEVWGWESFRRKQTTANYEQDRSRRILRTEATNLTTEGGWTHRKIGKAGGGGSEGSLDSQNGLHSITPVRSPSCVSEYNLNSAQSDFKFEHTNTHTPATPGSPVSHLLLGCHAVVPAFGF
jgi:hypothetical protein